MNDQIIEHHHIYVIGCGKYRKIGRAIDPKNRLAAIQTGNPILCTLEYVRPLRIKTVPLAERAAHEILKSKRVQGEWFRCTTEQAVKAISKACRQVIDAEVFKNGPLIMEWDDAADDYVLANIPENQHLAAAGWAMAHLPHRAIDTGRFE